MNNCSRSHYNPITVEMFNDALAKSAQHSRPGAYASRVGTSFHYDDREICMMGTDWFKEKEFAEKNLAHGRPCSVFGRRASRQVAVKS
jgi:hypothetical protein